MGKVRGRNSNGKTVKQTAEKWHVRGFVTSWCHTGATSQSWQGHATESRYSWSAGISPRQVMTWCWHDDDCDRHLAHHRDDRILFILAIGHKNDFEQKRTRGDKITWQMRHGSGAHENMTKRVKTPTDTKCKTIRRTSDAVQSRWLEPWPDVTGNFRNFLVLVGFL